MNRGLDEWMEGWLDGWMDEGRDGWMGWLNGWIVAQGGRSDGGLSKRGRGVTH